MGTGTLAPQARKKPRKPRPYAPGKYSATKILSASDRHLVSRFSYGLTPQLTAEVLAAGGGMAWLERQVAAAGSRSDDTLADWWPDLHLDPRQLLERHAAGTRYGYQVMRDYGNRLLLRRALTPHQLREVMTEFWENHLHVPALGEIQFAARASYGDAIRARALGRFDEILLAGISHPAMLAYLDNVTSTKARPNENLGRELLELHTVGVGNFTEDDVKNSARILTGWTVQLTPPYAAYLDPNNHYVGAVKVLGFDHPNSSRDGTEVAVKYLSYLAHHPQTASRIARKLATVFVSDTPSEALVASLAKVYLDNDTAVVPVLRALVTSKEFQASAGAKLRDTCQDIVATCRVLAPTLTAPPSSNDDSAANNLVTAAGLMGPTPMGWPAPDGIPVVAGAWSSAARVMASTRLHWVLATGTWPTRGITYATPASWFPSSTIVLRDLVDHLSRRLHGKVSTSQLLRAACEATGLTATAKLTATAPVTAVVMPRLLAVFLDHPDHMHH